MISYWTNFAKTSDPNGAGTPTWAPFGPNKTVLGLTAKPKGIKPVDFPVEHHCVLWDTTD
jgi:para-nitrobenzyl esterase